jgi:hypothetical protein
MNEDPYDLALAVIGIITAVVIICFSLTLF